MPKCKEVKNPCKICFTPVNQKTGLQCQGACKSWVHYACLNYTPGKIQDIKKGVIKVVCPCPDCKTKLVKEYRTDIYSCDNTGCPANRVPSCTNKKCSMYNELSEEPIPDNCGVKSCRQIVKFPPKESPAAKDSSSSEASATSTQKGRQTPKRSSCRRNAVSGPPKKSKTDVHGDHAKEQLPLAAVEQICNTVGQLACQLNELVEKMQNVTEGKKPKKDSSKNPPDCNNACKFSK